MKILNGSFIKLRLFFYLKMTAKDIVFIYGYLIDSFISIILNKNKNKNNIECLIVKLDALGDLFLSVKTIDCIISKKKSAIIVVDEAYVDLFTCYKGVSIFPINVKSYILNPFYRYKKLAYLYKFHYNQVINLNISRPHFVSDSIIREVESKYKVGFLSDNANSSSKIDFIYRRKYDYLVDVDFREHELDKLLRLLIYLKVNVDNTDGRSIIRSIASKSKIVKGDYYSIALGAGAPGRVWSYKNYILIIDFLYLRYGLQCVLLGAENEVFIAKKIILNTNNKTIDMSGKTNLVEYVTLIKNSKFIIANESSAIHIAEYYKKTSFCLCGGGHYGRFVPYPKNSNSRIISLIYKMKCYGCNWNCEYVPINKSVPPCISEINPNSLIKKLSIFL